MPTAGYCDWCEEYGNLGYTVTEAAGPSPLAVPVAYHLCSDECVREMVMALAAPEATEEEPE